MDKRTNQVNEVTLSLENSVFAGRIRKEVPAAMMKEERFPELYKTIDKDIFVTLVSRKENWVSDKEWNKLDGTTESFRIDVVEIDHAAGGLRWVDDAYDQYVPGTPVRELMSVDNDNWPASRDALDAADAHVKTLKVIEDRPLSLYRDHVFDNQDDRATVMHSLNEQLQFYAHNAAEYVEAMNGLSYREVSAEMYGGLRYGERDIFEKQINASDEIVLTTHTHAGKYVWSIGGDGDYEPDTYTRTTPVRSISIPPDRVKDVAFNDEPWRANAIRIQLPESLDEDRVAAFRERVQDAAQIAAKIEAPVDISLSQKGTGLNLLVGGKRLASEPCEVGVPPVGMRRLPKDARFSGKVTALYDHGVYPVYDPSHGGYKPSTSRRLLVEMDNSKVLWNKPGNHDEVRQENRSGVQLYAVSEGVFSALKESVGHTVTMLTMENKVTKIVDHDTGKRLSMATPAKTQSKGQSI
jgi:hypothetical protein